MSSESWHASYGSGARCHILLCQPPNCCFPFILPTAPQSRRTPLGDMRHTTAVMCQWSQPGDRYEEPVPSSFPTRGSSPHHTLFCHSLPFHYEQQPLLSQETSNFSFPSFAQRPQKTLPLTCLHLSPPAFYVGARTKLNRGCRTGGQL